MYILGSAQTKFGITERSLDQLIYESISNALEDAKISIDQIDAFVLSNNLAAMSEKQAHLPAALLSITGLNRAVVYNTEAACGSGGVSITKAYDLLAQYDTIMVIGAEKMSDFSTSEMLYYVAADSDRELEQREGLIFPAAGALVASMYMKRHKITANDLALISFKNHKNGKVNPYAHFYGKEVDLEMIENSPVLCSPLRLFDCSANSDGAVALILSNEDRKKSKVRIKASKASSFDLATFGVEDPIDFKGITELTNAALEAAGFSIEDIDIFEVHDGFSIMEMIVPEFMGLFELGKAKEAVRKGETEREGKYPINTTGGLKACGHPLGATGLRQIHDLKRQLEGKAEENQVKSAKRALAFNFGSIFKSIAVTILETTI